MLNVRKVCDIHALLGLLLPLFLLLPNHSVAGELKQVQWDQGGWLTEFDTGLEHARLSGRPAFVYFDAPWCSWCQQYKLDTLAHPQVRSILARDFISIKINYDARPDLVRRFGGRGLPFTLVLSPHGAELKRFVGVMSPTDLHSMLEALVLQPTHQPSQAISSVETLHQAGKLDRQGYEVFRAAYLHHLDTLFDPARETLFGQFETGVTYKHTPLLAWIYLMENGLWEERAQRAALLDRQRLWDTLDTGFFNFIDPTRDEYRESSKLLEANVWMAVRQAQAGQHDTQAQHSALHTWYFLREVLWDRKHAGFFQSKLADNAYYALPPTRRIQRSAPPIDRIKRTDTNAQAVWALIKLGKLTHNTEMTDYAVKTMNFLLRKMWHKDHLYHYIHNQQRAAPDLPHNWFWLLAAGAELERVRPDKWRHKQFSAISVSAAHWLQERMLDNTGEKIDNVLAGLIALSASQRDLYPLLTAQNRDWALSQLRIETESPPDELVIGLWAWERKLAE